MTKKIAFICSLGLIQMALGGNLSIPLLYYVVIFFFLAYNSINGYNTQESLKYISFSGICLLSILINQPPALFQAPLRWIFFSLILLSATPIFISYKITILRHLVFKYSLYLIVLFTVMNMIAFFLGIDMGEHYEEFKIFSGICNSNNLLGVMAGISFIFLSSLTMNIRRNFKKNIVFARILIITLIIISLIVLLMASSRAALGAVLISIILMILKRYRENTKKVIIIFIVISSLGIILSPIIINLSQGILWKQGGSISSVDTKSRDDLWKQRIDEFYSNPIIGCGFASTKKISEFSKISGGIIESGSGWGAILGQTGLLGIISFLIIAIPNWLYLILSKRNNTMNTLLLGITTFFLIHSWAEGYITTPGSPLCLYFWMTQGIAFAYRKKHSTIIPREIQFKIKNILL